jgi:hypothetical protein
MVSLASIASILVCRLLTPDSVPQKITKDDHSHLFTS